MTLLLIIIVVLFLAYSNGANDNFKGVATLFGSETLKYKTALIYATFTTLLGSVMAILLAGQLLNNFSGKGLVPTELLGNPNFSMTVALGAATTVYAATKIGMPISTTHGITGALAGTGIVANYHLFNFEKLFDSFVLPLLISPILALSVTFTLYFIFNKLRIKIKVADNSCICIQETNSAKGSCNGTIIATTELELKKGEFSKDCNSDSGGKTWGISAKKTLNYAHFISAGTVSFARGLNDTPKIAGILLLTSSLNKEIGLVLIGLTIAIGGWLNAKKVAETMSKKIVTMNDGQGFTANLSTALLVTTASLHGLPVSTTHASVGSILGIGIANKTGNKKVIREIVLSWALTLPIAALVSGLTYYLLNLVLL